MDGTRFDALVRGMGGGRTRRGFVGLLAALAAGGVVNEAGAKRRCRRDSPAGQCCRKDGTCTCKDGGTVCGTNCCRIGQTCVDGTCSAMPEPPVCLTYGQPCKNVGVPCCEGMACGSGQGGDLVACWVQKTGRCDSTSECIYGTECKDGICVGLPPAPTCVADACPECKILNPSTPKEALAKVCIGAECGCVCKAASSGANSTTGAACSFQDESQCTGSTDCYDMALNVPCKADSKTCCCMGVDG